MKLDIIGLTGSTLMMNKIGLILKGNVRGIVTIDSDEKMSEFKGLYRAKLLDVVDIIDGSKEEFESNVGELRRTKIGKKSLGHSDSDNFIADAPRRSEQQRVIDAENETQKMGSRVVVGTSDGSIKVSTMTNFMNLDKADSEDDPSIVAMRKLEEEEKNDILNLDRDPNEILDLRSYVTIGPENNKMKMHNNIVNRGSADEAFVENDAKRSKKSNVKSKRKYTKKNKTGSIETKESESKEANAESNNEANEVVDDILDTNSKNDDDFLEL